MVADNRLHGVEGRVNFDGPWGGKIYTGVVHVAVKNTVKWVPCGSTVNNNGCRALEARAPLRVPVVRGERMDEEDSSYSIVEVVRDLDGDGTWVVAVAPLVYLRRVAVAEERCYHNTRVA